MYVNKHNSVISITKSKNLAQLSQTYHSAVLKSCSNCLTFTNFYKSTGLLTKCHNIIMHLVHIIPTMRHCCCTAVRQISDSLAFQQSIWSWSQILRHSCLRQAEVQNQVPRTRLQSCLGHCMEQSSRPPLSY